MPILYIYIYIPSGCLFRSRAAEGEKWTVDRREFEPCFKVFWEDHQLELPLRIHPLLEVMFWGGLGPIHAGSFYWFSSGRVKRVRMPDFESFP